MTNPIRILIVDDHFLVRIGLLTTLRMDPGFEAVGEAGTGQQALELYDRLHPDLVLLDLRLPDLSGIEVTAELCRRDPAAKIIIISSYDAADEICGAFHAGARGYLLKDVLGEELFQALRRVAAGACYVPAELAALTPGLPTRSGSSQPQPQPIISPPKPSIHATTDLSPHALTEKHTRTPNS